MVQKTTSNLLDSQELAKSLGEGLLRQFSVQGGELSSLNDLRDFVAKHPVTQLLFEKLDYSFQNIDYLLEALAHKSFIHEFPQVGLNSYERFEFLGDALLGSIITERLLKDFPKLSEGELSRFKGSLVNAHALSTLAVLLDLNKMIFLGKGEYENNGHLKESLLCDVFESLLGAIYLDSNYEKLKKVFENVLYLYEEKHENKYISFDRFSDFDAKTQLQEKVMALYKTLPEYISHEKGEEFKVSLNICGKTLATIHSTSKKKAQKELAKKVLKEKLYMGLGG